jgi:hypothetical protein
VIAWACKQAVPLPGVDFEHRRDRREDEALRVKTALRARLSQHPGPVLAVRDDSHDPNDTGRDLGGVDRRDGARSYRW